MIPVIEGPLTECLLYYDFQDVQGGEEDGAEGDRTPEAVGEVWPQQKRQARTRPLHHRGHGWDLHAG